MTSGAMTTTRSGSDRVHDVVIVGGGIAGAALATVLAADGLSVVVAEATRRFGDRVRGESMMPWGVAEAQQLGLAGVLEDAGAHTTPTWLRYSQGDPAPRAIPVGLLVPGVRGTLNLGHPTACQALLDAAEAAGAHVVRGARDVTVELGGSAPVVELTHDRGRARWRAGLVVGADGRASVVRRAAGIVLDEQPASSFVAGLLVEGVTGADDHDVVAEHEHGMSLVLRQRGGRARAYHVVDPRDRARYARHGGAERFIDDLRAATPELAESLAGAQPAGPCAAFPGTDTWTDRPFADAVVLVGDAAGHNDPTVGCGLSIAMRDVRIVHALIAAGARRADGFEAYGVERAERMRRLRLIGDLMNAAVVVSGPDRAERRARFRDAMTGFDLAVFPLILGMFAGPETIPADAADERVLALVG